MALLFLDVQGFSKLVRDHELEIYRKFGLEKLAKVMHEHPPDVVNTWGDALFAAYADPKHAARAALEMRDLFRNEPWEDHGCPFPLRARIAMHCGTVHRTEDPVTGRANVFGPSVNHAARVEPIVQADEVWLTSTSTELLASLHQGAKQFRLTPVGTHCLPKGAGAAELYCLRREREPAFEPEAVGRACSFLRNFIEAEEPGMLGACPATIGFTRAYRLLLHMFRRENFESFCAFDLAFDRWEELVNEGEAQTLNVSNQIFRAMEDMVKYGRCRSFRRILVVPGRRLADPLTRRVLEFISKAERGWGAANAQVDVETRVLAYPELPTEQEDIRGLCDFALFEGKGGECLSIVEPALSTVNVSTDPEVATCRIDWSSSEGRRLREGFERHWARSRPLVEGPRSGGGAP